MRKKSVAAIGMASVLAISCQFMPSADVGGVNLTGMPVAEAGFGGLGDIGKKVGKDAVSKAFNVDIDGMQDKRQDMLLNLYRAAVSYAMASAHTQKAFEMGDGGVQALAAVNQLNSNKTNLGSIKSVMDASKIDKKTLEEASKKLLDSGDQAKIEAANAYLKDAKAERKAANIYKVLAARDAAIIIKDAATAMAKGGDSIQDKLNIIQDLSNVAKQGEGVAKVIGEQHKGMSDALKGYEKKQNIKEVSDADAKKMSANWLEE